MRYYWDKAKADQVAGMLMMFALVLGPVFVPAFVIGYLVIWFGPEWPISILALFACGLWVLSCFSRR